MKKYTLFLCVSLFAIVLSGCTKQIGSTNTASDINQNLNNSNSSNTNHEGELTPAEIKSLTHSSCVTFDLNHKFYDPNNAFYVSNVEPLKALAVDWQYGNICSSVDRSILVINVSRPINENAKTELDTITRTKVLYPRLSKDIIPSSEDTEYYQVYLYANYPTDLTYGNAKRTLEVNKVYPIVDLAWSAALAGCQLEPGNYVADKGFIIACGGGDNGCASMERVKWNIITEKSTYLGDCTNNCDLATNESFKLTCNP